MTMEVVIPVAMIEANSKGDVSFITLNYIVMLKELNHRHSILKKKKNL